MKIMFAALSIGSFFIALASVIENTTGVNWQGFCIAGFVFAVISKGVKE